MLRRALLFAALVALSAPAAATLQLSANINGFLFDCADQQACDTNLTPGVLAIANQTFNGVDIFGSTQIETIGTTNFLNTSSFQVVNHNLAAASVVLAIGGTNFLGPVSSFVSSGSGTWQNAAGSTIDLSWYGDAANTQGADNPLDLPGLLLDSFFDLAVGAADAFAHNGSGPFFAGGLHSMTLGTSGTLAAWNGVAGQEATLVGRSQTIITTQVPEPGMLALLAAGLLGLGWSRRRKT